jgi:tRNA pseudouridine55 synthase
MRKRLGIKKAGHAGTLDPKATGLLVVCTNRRTKAITQYQDLPKTYSGKFYLGATTASLDVETPVIEEKPIDHISSEMIEQTAKKLVGEIEQIPPMYSAMNFHGKKLYELARKGKSVSLEPRKITIYEFIVTEIALPYVGFKVICSKGTYIRTLAADFGKALGTVAHLSELRRETIGEYSVDDAYSPAELAQRFNEGSPTVLLDEEARH